LTFFVKEKSKQIFPAKWRLFFVRLQFGKIPPFEQQMLILPIPLNPIGHSDLSDRPFRFKRSVIPI
jgi:hypothetical protein